MAGVITGREVVMNLGTLFREFGAKTSFRVLWALASGRKCTFLEVVMETA